MTTTNTPANFGGTKPIIDPDDTVMLLIDHQSGLFQTVGDMPMPELRARAAALAKMATLAKLPIAAVHDGYKVFAVIDVLGTYSKMAQEITLARVVQAGVVPMDTAAVASELQKTWNREDAMQ